MDLFEKCLSSHSYVSTRTFKETTINIVAIVTKKKKRNRFLAKFLIISRAQGSLEKCTMDTEIEALLYFRSFGLPFFPKYIEDYKCGDDHMLVEEFIDGKVLIDFVHRKMSGKWWRSLLAQLILYVSILEDNRILHNDFWDANVILHPISAAEKHTNVRLTFKYIRPSDDAEYTFHVVNAGFIIKVVDYQYTHQYKKESKIYSPLVASHRKCDAAEKERIGWSSKFHLGGDLNQMLGILSEYKFIPPRLKKNIRKKVIHRKGEDFPYAIQCENVKTSGVVLLSEFDELFK